MKEYSIEDLMESSEQIIYRTNIPVDIAITNSLIYINLNYDTEVISIKYIESIVIFCEDFDMIRYSDDTDKLNDCCYYYNDSNGNDNRLGVKIRMVSNNNVAIIYDIKKLDEAYKFYKSLRTVWPFSKKVSKQGLYPKELD